MRLSSSQIKVIKQETEHFFGARRGALVWGARHRQNGNENQGIFV